MLARSNSETSAFSIVMEPMEKSVRTFCWGDDGSGQCMGGARSTMEAFVPSPTEVRMPESKRDIVQIGVGYEQSFVILANGGIWCGGANNGKCLSEEGESGQFLGPQRLDRTEADEFETGAIAVGRDHFVAVQRDGTRLLTWAASNEFGQSGQGDSHVSLGSCNPKRFAIQSATLGTVRVCAVACGENHSLALTEHGEVFSWGSNSVGQLGLPDLAIGSACSAPRCVNAGGIRGLSVRQIAAGSQHSMALGISGQVVSWGDNRRGRLGLGVDYEDQAAVLVPARVEEPGKDVRLISAGGAHSAVVMRGGALFLVGDNRCGQLGHPPDELNCISVWVEFPFREYGLKVRAVSLGESHTLVLSDHGELFGVGSNDRGQIGEPLEACVYMPRQVQLPDPQLFIWAVAAGPGHSMVLASSPPPSHVISRRSESPAKMARTLSKELRAIVPMVVDSDDDDAPLERSVTYTGSNIGLPCKLEKISSHPPEETPELLRASGCPSRAAETPRLSISLAPKSSTVLPGSVDVVREDFILQRPIARPGVIAKVPFACLMIAKLQDMALLLDKEGEGRAKDFRDSVAATLRSPSMLASSFIVNGLYGTRLDAGSLLQQLLAARSKLPPALETDLAWAGAVRQGLSALCSSAPGGILKGFETRDQVRVLVLYLLIPDWVKLLEARPNEMLVVVEDLLRTISRLSLNGRKAFRDLIADECANLAVFRDCLLPSARRMADAAVHKIVEHRRTPQKGHVVWDCILLLQLLWGAEAQRLEIARTAARVARTSSDTAELVRIDSAGVSRSLSASLNARARSVKSVAGATLALPLSCFHINAVIESGFPPPLELQIFMQHAKMKAIDPGDFFTDPSLEVDDKGDLPVRMMSFMANGNLMPTSYKRRVLQAENEETQRQQSGGVALTPWGLEYRVIPFVLEVRRDHILHDTVGKLETAAVEDLRKPLKIRFTGEEGIDEGGVAREYFRLLSKQVFAPEFGMFKADPESRYLWFDPASLNEGVDFWTIGVVLGLAVYNNLPGLDVNLPAALFKKVKDMPLNLEDLQVLFPSLANSLQAVLQWEPPDGTPEEEANKLFEDIFCLDFSVSYDAYGSTKVVSLLPQSTDEPGGKADFATVTLSTRKEFVELMKEWWLTVGVQKFFAEFRKGFLRVCGGSKIFAELSASELEATVCGERDLDFANLRKGAKVVESTVPFRAGYVDDLWELLLGFDVMQKRQFLNFVTGSDLAPVGGLELLEFKIQRNGGEPTDQLPTSHTCFNLLTLPEYNSKEKLSRLLLMAIENAEGFGLE